jgi:hypothetical protein
MPARSATQGSQPLHQAAFPTSSIVFVKNAFFSCLVESADGFKGGFTSCGGIAFGDCQAGLFHFGAGAPTKNSVAQAAFLVLPIALLLRLDIGQDTASKTNVSNLLHGGLFYWIPVVLSRKYSFLGK